MNRRSFLKRAGLALGLALAPALPTFGRREDSPSPDQGEATLTLEDLRAARDALEPTWSPGSFRLVVHPTTRARLEEMYPGSTRGMLELRPLG